MNWLPLANAGHATPHATATSYSANERACWERAQKYVDEHYTRRMTYMGIPLETDYWAPPGFKGLVAIEGVMEAKAPGLAQSDLRCRSVPHVAPSTLPAWPDSHDAGWSTVADTISDMYGPALRARDERIAADDRTFALWKQEEELWRATDANQRERIAALDSMLQDERTERQMAEARMESARTEALARACDKSVPIGQRMSAAVEPGCHIAANPSMFASVDRRPLSPQAQLYGMPIVTNPLMPGDTLAFVQNGKVVLVVKVGEVEGG